jgi:hypothetical protein
VGGDSGEMILFSSSLSASLCMTATGSSSKEPLIEKYSLAPSDSSPVLPSDCSGVDDEVACPCKDEELRWAPEMVVTFGVERLVRPSGCLSRLELAVS